MAQPQISFTRNQNIKTNAKTNAKTNTETNAEPDQFKKQESNTSVDMCVICMDPLHQPPTSYAAYIKKIVCRSRIRTLPCDGNHQFHRACINKWFKIKKLHDLCPSCPLCNTRFIYIR